MNSIEFGKKCRPFLKEYFSLFGEAPSPSDYACSHETFLDALERAVTDKRPISDYLSKVDYVEGSKH